MPIPTPLLVLALLLAALVIVQDLHARRVPNTALVATLVLGMVWQLLTLGGVVEATPPGFLMAGVALLAGFAAMLPFYVIGWMGAGDVKFVAVLGFLLGFKPLFIVWVLGNVLLATHTFLILAGRMAMRRQPQLAVLQMGWQKTGFHQLIQRPRQGRKGMPYAAYLGVGVFLHAFAMPWLGIMP